MMRWWRVPKVTFRMGKMTRNMGEFTAGILGISMGWWDKHWILKKQRNRDYEIIGYNINRIYRIYYI